MNEYTILWTAVGSVAGVLIASALYALGGRKGKWKRRFVASFVLSTTLCVASLIMGVFSFYFLLTYPLLILGFSLGYSGQSSFEKVLKRTLYALAVCTAGVVCAIVLGGRAWLVLPLHIAVGLGSVFLGLKNPVHAAAEEVFVCMLLNMGLVMYPFIVRPV